MKDYTEYPIPHYVYDDGVTSLLLGPGFEQDACHLIYNMSDEFLEAVKASYTLNEARFCANSTCVHHKDVFPKYKSLDEKQVTYQEMLTVVLHDMQPNNAKELACIVHLVYAFQHDRMEETKPTSIQGAFGNFIQQFMQDKIKPEVDPEQAVKDLLRDIKEEGASKHTTLDPWASRFDETGEDVSVSFGISMPRYKALQLSIATLFRDNRDDSDVEVHHITAKVFNTVTVLNGGEREFRSWLCGMLSEITSMYRHNRDILGGIA